MTGLALGLDGGGTRTRALAATGDGTVLGEGFGGACNIAALPLDEALGSAAQCLLAALTAGGGRAEDVRAVCVGVAGWSFEDRRWALREGLQRLFPQAQIAVVPDYAIALTGATDGGPGVIVIAGTGSIAYGENARGEAHRTGGYGFLIDDAGSGYGVGRQALSAVLHAEDGTAAATSLQGRIRAALGITAAAEIIPGIYGGDIDRVQVAALSRVVAEAAVEDSDEVARAILMRTGGALAHLAQGVTTRLFADETASFPLVTVGGLWEAGPALSDVFTRSLRRFAPQAIPQPPQSAPVQGALRRATAMLDDPRQASRD